MTRVALGILLTACGFGASGQATSPSLKIRVIAEVETKVKEGGREVTHLVPADRVVPGDEVLYTLEIRNVSRGDVVAPTVTNPVPAHMQYVADSASGPGAEITYSADGGATFDTADNIKQKASDYTHIRWQLRNTLKSHAVAFVRFRAVVR
jgi:uncharacterized repeat protein (TIGR01451 family)